MATKKQCFPVTAGQCTYELTAVETACIRPEQAQARQNPIMEKEDEPQAPPLAVELLTTGRCQEKGESILSQAETSRELTNLQKKAIYFKIYGPYQLYLTFF